MRKRTVEMYAGKTEPREWYTFFVKIPADTPEDQIPDVSIAHTQEMLDDLNVEIAFIGVYWIPGEDDQEYDEEEILENVG